MAAKQLMAASKRPVRHNRKIERGALWHILSLDEDCTTILDPSSALSELVRPTTGSIESRYEAEAAMRTIPQLVPFAPQESKLLRTSHNLDNFRFEYGIGDVTLGQLALFEHWHDWLWVADGSEPTQSRSPESRMLEASCSRLSIALDGIIEEALPSSKNA